MSTPVSSVSRSDRIRAGVGIGIAALMFLLLGGTVRSAIAAPGDELTIEQKRRFLATAKIIRSRGLSKGVTSPDRLTLTDGSLTHDAVFQAIDERPPHPVTLRGRTELVFRDYYGYNVAAFELALMLGWEDVVPVTVERTWKGQRGALSWWVDAKWDEQSRRKEEAQPPDPVTWSYQIHRMRLFSMLTGDTDRNMGNLLITADWRLVLIDFTRAFRLAEEPAALSTLRLCDRATLARLRALDPRTVEERLGKHLNGMEIRSLFARRDAILKHLETLIATRGERAVIWDDSSRQQAVGSSRQQAVGSRQ